MRYLPFVLFLALVIYALVDCVRHEDAEMPVGLPKAIWVVLIIVFPGAGAIAWLVVSRAGRQAGRVTRPGPPSPSSGGFPGRPAPRRPAPRPVAPDDDPEFLASLDRQRPRPEPSPDGLAPTTDDAQRSDDDADGPPAGGATSPSDEDNGPAPRR